MTAGDIVPIGSRAEFLDAVRSAFTRAEEHGANPIEVVGVAFPGSREGFGVAEAALVRLLRRVVVRVHHDRLGTINDVVALGAGPAGVLIVFGVLHRFEEAAA